MRRKSRKGVRLLAPLAFLPRRTLSAIAFHQDVAVTTLGPRAEQPPGGGRCCCAQIRIPGVGRNVLNLPSVVGGRAREPQSLHRAIGIRGQKRLPALWVANLFPAAIGVANRDRVRFTRAPSVRECSTSPSSTIRPGFSSTIPGLLTFDIGCQPDADRYQGNHHQQIQPVHDPLECASFTSVKGVLHRPEAKPMKRETQDAILFAVAKARSWIDG
jgi:hypothetical protein